MGTNHYHRTNICACCNRFDERHISKSWSGFQGYRPDPWPDGSKTSIQSWEDWKRVLRADGEVWSEYGYSIPVEDFIDEVERTSPEDRARQYRWIQENMPNELEGPEPNYWLDADGFTFSIHEFF